jgi:hypothetical protein
MPRESAVEVPAPLLGRLRDEPMLFSALEYGDSFSGSGGNIYPGFASINGSTSNVAGSWIELISTSVETHCLMLSIYGMAVSATDTRGLVDVATGASGAETVIVSSLPAGFSSTIQAQGFFYMIPVYIPSGTRISVRLRSFIASDLVTVQIATLVDGSFGYRRNLATSVDTYGAVTASSRGTNMPTSDTYVEITSATTRPYRMLAMLPCGGTGTAYAAASNVTYTLATGPSGSEVVQGTRSVSTTSAEILHYRNAPFDYGLFYGPFPQGIRIACKQSTGVNYRDVIVLGIP